MSDSEINEKLGMLLADRERATEDRVAMRTGIERVHERLGDLVGLPDQFTKHEKLDSERHQQNSDRLDAIDKRLAAMERWRSRWSGARGAVKAIVAFVISVLGLLAAWWRLR